MRPVFFSTPSEFRQWLMRNHDTITEIWVGFYKKNSGKKGITYAEALDEALCFGWIDGLVNKFDDASYMQRFTPRRNKSVWSKINTSHIERLIREGKMMPSGLLAVDAAKKDGRWARAYNSPSAITVPDDFLKELAVYAKADVFYKTLNKANVYAIAYRLANAKKPETRQKWIRKIIEMLEAGKKFH